MLGPTRGFRAAPRSNIKVRSRTIQKYGMDPALALRQMQGGYAFRECARRDYLEDLGGEMESSARWFMVSLRSS
jgi:hypothetical protein